MLIKPEEFENGNFITTVGPSVYTIIRHENEVFRKRLSNRRNLKTETLLLRLDLSFTLIPQENGAF